MALVFVLKKYLGDLLKVVVDCLPGHGDHVVKQRHLLESFDSQNLEHDVHDDERLKKEKIGGDFDLFIELEINFIAIELRFIVNIDTNTRVKKLHIISHIYN